MISNEQLCKRIQKGEHSLISDIILNNEGIVNRLSSYYLPLAERNGGADIDDLKQAARIGLLLAVNRWDVERGAFITIAMRYMRNEIRALLSIRSTKETIENNAAIVSLQSPIGDGEEAALLDVIEDEAAENPCDVACSSDLREQVRAAVEALPQDCKEAIIQYYFNGEPLRKIDKSARDKAIRALHRNSVLRDLVADYRTPLYHWGGLQDFKHSRESSVERAADVRERIRAKALAYLRCV